MASFLAPHPLWALSYGDTPFSTSIPISMREMIPPTKNFPVLLCDPEIAKQLMPVIRTGVFSRLPVRPGTSLSLEPVL